MKTMTITAAVLAALTLATIATISSSSVSDVLARGEGFSQPSMPIGQLTANAQNLPVQSYDAF